MPYDKDELDEQGQEVLERNVEQSKELIDAKQRKKPRRGESEPDVHRPPRDDPRFNDQSVPPGQDDLPAGGTSGGEIIRDSG